MDSKLKKDLCLKYKACKKCGSTTIGSGSGSMTTTDGFRRTCACGWKVEISKDGTVDMSDGSISLGDVDITKVALDCFDKDKKLGVRQSREKFLEVYESANLINAAIEECMIYLQNNYVFHITPLKSVREYVLQDASSILSFNVESYSKQVAEIFKLQDRPMWKPSPLDNPA